jgi:hypothetical protein
MVLAAAVGMILSAVLLRRVQIQASATGEHAQLAGRAVEGVR